jgi:gas vesicle protein
MNNIIDEEKDHTLLYIGIAAGVTLGIAAAYLFLTEKGAVYRKRIAEVIKENISNQAAQILADKTIIPEGAAKAATDAVVK